MSKTSKQGQPRRRKAARNPKNIFARRREFVNGNLTEEKQSTIGDVTLALVGCIIMYSGAPIINLINNDDLLYLF